MYCSAQPSFFPHIVLNDVDKRFIYQLMSKVQLPGSVRFDSQIKMHTGTENKDVSLAK